MLAVVLGLTLAFAEPGDSGDTADTAEPHDTGPYVDTGATAEKVFDQDVGCGGGAAFGVLVLAALGGTRSKRR